MNRLLLSDQPLLPGAGEYGEDVADCSTDIHSLILFDDDVMSFIGMGHLSRPLDSDFLVYP